MMRILLDLALTIVVASFLSLAFHLDKEPPRAAATASPEQIAMDECGAHAALVWLDDGTITCRRFTDPTLVAGAKP